MAILLGIISASTSYHIAQCYYDLILNQINSSNDRKNVQERINAKIHSSFIIISNTLVYIRMFLPMIVMFIFVISIHLNHTMISNHMRSKQEWYQIGNFIFYVLSLFALIAYILLIVYDNMRREQYGEQVDRQEMNRLIRELRQERFAQNTVSDDSSSDKNKMIIEDYHGLGFWLSINAKSILSANISHPICCKVKK